MSFDNLTLAGLLFTLLYIALLMVFNKKKPKTKQVEPFVFEYQDSEPCRYGT